MEYFIGSLFTLLMIFIVGRVNSKQNGMHKIKLMHTQSRSIELMKSIVSSFTRRPTPKTQSYDYKKKNSIRTVYLEDKAYWILNNAVYEANVVDGIIDDESTKTVDTMTMSKVELDKISFIVEKLTEGLTNDSGNSGKP